MKENDYYGHYFLWISQGRRDGSHVPVAGRVMSPEWRKRYGIHLGHIEHIEPVRVMESAPPLESTETCYPTAGKGRELLINNKGSFTEAFALLPRMCHAQTDTDRA